MKGTYGVDVAMQRRDDLDRKVIAHITKCIAAGEKVSVVDIGCATGGLALPLIRAGAQVLAIDIADYTRQFRTLREKYKLHTSQLQFLCGDVRQHRTEIADRKPDIAVLQRMIHYLPYTDAQKVLVSLKKAGVQRLYLSVTGLESDIGRNYPAKDVPISQRFVTLPPDDAQVFSITQPLCLYTPEECMRLLQDSQWGIEEFWISSFGNIKAVCS